MTHLESNRPHYHFTPPEMWLNDPNGLVYYAGEYHLFYQYHPKSIVWGPMHWGHAVSPDLSDWQHLPIALFPDEHGMIFSGSAVVERENTAGFGREALVAIFTYNINYNETQNLAYSTDQGRTWTKYAGNPVVPAPNPLSECRDPKVFWHNDHWVMLLAAKNKILFYTSPDLKQWKQTGIFGNGYGSTAGVWETPELFQLPTETQTRWGLTVGVGDGAPAGGSGTQYFIGDFDGMTFTSENPQATILWMDYGADYYAPQSWNSEPNNRRLMIAWMNNWKYARDIPVSTGRGMCTLIREMSLAQTTDGIRLSQKPLPEISNLRHAHQHWQAEVIHPHKNILADIRGKALEIIASFTPSLEVECFGFHLRVGKTERTTVSYSVKDQTLIVDRKKSGKVNFHRSFPRIHSAHLTPIQNTIKLHIFIDISSIEIFANDGLLTFTECIFPSEQSQGLALFAEGGTVALNSLDIYHLEPAVSPIGGIPT